MPLLKLTTSVALTESARGPVLADLSRLLAARLGKPEAYVMTALEPVSSMTFGGTSDPSLYAELKNVGRFTPDQTRKLSAELCTALAKAFGIPSGRIYIEFTPSEGYLWGHDGETFR